MDAVFFATCFFSGVFASWQENIKPRTRKNGIVFIPQNYNVCAEN
jgi:hypothetical protein